MSRNTAPACLLLCGLLLAPGAWAQDDAEEETLIVDLRPDTGVRGAASQNFGDSTLPGYTSKAWDDFTIDRRMEMTRGLAWFQPGWGGESVSFLVEVADRPGGAEAGGRVVLDATGRYDASTGNVAFDFRGAELPPGTWWLTVQAGGGYDAFREVRWHRANPGSPRGSEFHWHQPGGGSGLGSNPVKGSTGGAAPADLAFRLFGEPASVSATVRAGGEEDDLARRIAFGALAAVCLGAAFYLFLMILNPHMRRRAEHRWFGAR